MDRRARPGSVDFAHRPTACPFSCCAAATSAAHRWPRRCSTQRAALCGAPLSVQSAGFATEGEPPPQATLAAARRLGIDLSAHRSRLLTADMLAEADLVIGMTRAHVWDAALMHPEIVPRAFVIGELARLNREIGPRKVDEPFADWVDRLHRASEPGQSPRGRRRDSRSVRAATSGAQQGRATPRTSSSSHLGDCAFEPLYEFSRSRWCEGRLIWHPGMDGPAAPGDASSAREPRHGVFEPLRDTDPGFVAEVGAGCREIGKGVLHVARRVSPCGAGAPSVP